MISFYKHDHGQNVTKRNFWRLNSPQTLIIDRFHCHATKKNKLETIQWKWNAITKRLICEQFVQVSGLCGPQFPIYLPKGFMHLCSALCGPFWWGFAKTRPVAPAARDPQPTTRDGPAVPRPSGRVARRPGGPVSWFSTDFLSSGKSTRMHRSASGLGVRNGRRWVWIRLLF